MKKTMLIGGFLALCLMGSGFARAESMDKMPGMDTAASKGERVVLVGEVVDMDCYMNEGLHGRKHQSCAVLCLKNGSPVGLLTDDGHAYFLAADKDETKYYSVLRRMGGDRVKVTGVLQKRGGALCLTVDKSEKL
ncbi:MAG TPA: hypothetical protein VK914_02725 [bacterium]|jgi:hypothetical protein|nr:hypothetical protein [bacterium]